MFCPFCHAEDTKVVDSRLTDKGERIRRRRECLNCLERFTTMEEAVLSYPRVVKRDGRRVEFDEVKLRHGLLKALEKRCVCSDAIHQALLNIKHQIRSSGEREMASDFIGGLVMNSLRELDHVAFVRFASVYRSFEDVEAFKQAIKHLEENHE